MKPALLIFTLLTGIASYGQDSLPATASLNAYVTNFTNKPLKGIVVLFSGETTGKVFSGISDANGKFSRELPPGDRYNISLKDMRDTAKYAVVDIPALNPGEYYSEPFTVRIKYEPAKSYTLDNVHFDFGKSSLRAESYPELNELYDYLQRHPSIKIEIAGHTDNVGNAGDNQKLSESRAAAIKNYLIRKGISGSRLTARGYGATKPVASNETDEGRQKNRRTEVHILE